MTTKEDVDMSGARNLSDLDVGEVSMVDRAAIERKFVVIKRAEETDTTIEGAMTTKKDDAEKGKIEEKDDAEKAKATEKDDAEKAKAEKDDAEKGAGDLAASIKAVTPWLKEQAGKASGPMAAHLNAVASELGKRKITKSEAAEAFGVDIETVEKAKRMTDARARKLSEMAGSLAEFAKQFGNEEDEDEMKDKDKAKDKAKVKKSVAGDEVLDGVAISMAAVAKAIEGLSADKVNLSKRIEQLETRQGPSLGEAPAQATVPVKKSREQLDSELFSDFFA